MCQLSSCRFLQGANRVLESWLGRTRVQGLFKQFGVISQIPMLVNISQRHLLELLCGNSGSFGLRLVVLKAAPHAVVNLALYLFFLVFKYLFWHFGPNYWLLHLGITPGGLWEPYGVPRIETRSVVCRALAFPDALFLQSLGMEFLTLRDRTKHWSRGTRGAQGRVVWFWQPADQF